MTNSNPPISKIFYNGKQIIDKRKDKNKLIYTLTDGTEVFSKNLGKVEIECNECFIKISIHLYYKIYEKYYLCFSCSNKGERNSFYGKKHTEEFKQKLSDDRKGIYLLGEKNPMYGLSPKDYLTPEQLEIKREKNRQDTLNREYNPFKTSMRILLGDERFEQSVQKARNTVANFSEEKKKEISKKLSDSQIRAMQENPEKYISDRRKAGLITAAKKISYKMNKFEAKIDEWLTRNDIEHEYSAIMNTGSNNVYQYDFLITGKRILIECNGTYWHSDPRFYSNVDDDKKNINSTQEIIREKDKKKKDFAVQKNFQLIYVWEYDINNGDYSVLEEALLNNEN